MFNKENKDKQLQDGNTLTHNNLHSTLSIQGTVKATKDIRIDGKLDGDLVAQSKAVIGQTATIEGNIDCQHAIIEGKINGNVKVWEILEMRSTAVINGDIVANKLVIEDGAVFNGACQMGKKALNATKHDDKRQGRKVSKQKQKAS